jgi:hypothetical protein
MELGRDGEATDSLKRALEVCEVLEDPGLFFGTSASLAWHLAHMGDLNGALERIQAARDRMPGSAGPRRESYLAMCHTDALIRHRRPVEEVIAAAEPALMIGRELQMDFHYMTVTRTNVAEALINTGRVHRAAELLAQFSISDTYDHWSLRWISAEVAIAEGRLDDGLTAFLALEGTGNGPENHLNSAHWIAIAQLWKGDPAAAWAAVIPAMEGLLESATLADYGGSFATAARAAADLARRPDGRDHAQHLRATLDGLRGRALVDPLGPGPAPIVRPAVTAQWHAELARIDDLDTVEQWSLAATSWDAFSSPHDAAYCRWRASQVALREGQGAVAARLLKRAATEAREHVPLQAAIRATGQARA